MAENEKKSLTYKDAGVDVDEGNRFASMIQPFMRRTFGPQVLDNPGGFAGMFSLDNRAELFSKHYEHPVLVGATDGVGTKLKVAFMTGKHDTVGIDLVAMSVNDLIVQGAEPLFFLDYMASGAIAVEKKCQIISGIAEGCRQAGCALLGGETAEMPGFYQEGEYDLAGFAVGVFDQSRGVGQKRVKPGDKVIGLASNGLHSNGFSLVRKIFFDEERLSPSQHIEELGTTLGEELLKPTRIYVKPILRLLAQYKVKAVVRRLAHITGGGFIDNIPRVLAKDCSVVIRKGTWEVPPIFGLIQKLGSVPESEMYRVFNMGIGMVLIVLESFVDSIIKKLEKSGERAFLIGEVVSGDGTVGIK